MREAVKSKPLIMIVIAGILLTSLTSMPFVYAQSTQTSLTIAVPAPPQGRECTIEATLKDVHGNSVPTMDIAFSVCGSYTIGTATTDSNGVASLTYTFSMAETYSVTAMFSGTTDYAPSSSEYVDIIIVDYTLYLVGGGLITVAIIAGYLVVRRRKKAIFMPMTVKEAE
jgi:hypothetical protein